MLRFSAGDLQRQWGKIQDMALAEPVTVTCNGRDRMVLMSSDEYYRLRRRDRRVMSLDDYTEADLQALLAAEPPPESAEFDHEVNG